MSGRLEGPMTAPGVCPEHCTAVLSSCIWDPRVGSQRQFSGSHQKEWCRKSQSTGHMAKLSMKLLYVNYTCVHLCALGSRANLTWVMGKSLKNPGKWPWLLLHHVTSEIRSQLTGGGLGI